MRLLLSGYLLAAVDANKPVVQATISVNPQLNLDSTKLSFALASPYRILLNCHSPTSIRYFPYYLVVWRRLKSKQQLSLSIVWLYSPSSDQRHIRGIPFPPFSYTMSGTTTPPRRRFAPIPVETTTKTNRKFAPVPVETSVRSSKKADAISTADFGAAERSQDPPGRRRFAIEPIETAVTSNRKAIPAPEPTPVPTPESRSPTGSTGNGNARPVRRFKPELIESCARSKKNGSNIPATLPTDKTDITPGTDHIYAGDKNIRAAMVSPGFTTPRISAESLTSRGSLRPKFRSIPQRKGSMKPHVNTRRSTRRDSFVPELESIESSESEEGGLEDDGRPDTPSLSGSIVSSEDSIMRSQIARTRESCDDRFSGYLLELAAKAAEKQLREEALAAFANNDMHQPVEHYYDREIDGHSEDGSIAIARLPHEILGMVDDSQTSDWSSKEHATHLETIARQMNDNTSYRNADEPKQGHFNDPFWTNSMTVKPEDVHKQAELKKMRDAACPPMLGDDLEFRLCEEPEVSGNYLMR